MRRLSPGRSKQSRPPPPSSSSSSSSSAVTPSSSSSSSDTGLLRSLKRSSTEGTASSKEVSIWEGSGRRGIKVFHLTPTQNPSIILQIQLYSHKRAPEVSAAVKVEIWVQGWPLILYLPVRAGLLHDFDVDSTFLQQGSAVNGEHVRAHSWNFPKYVKLHRNSSKTRSFCSMSSPSVNNEGSGREKWLVGDKDGVIIVDHGSRRQESNLMLNEFVAMFRNRTGYQIVEPAHMELAKPSIGDAFRLCVEQGAKRVIVNPFFLLPGRHWNQDIPSLTAEAAKEHPGISYIVTAPLGLHELLVDVMNERINHCLQHAAGRVGECAVCAGTDGCGFR